MMELIVLTVAVATGVFLIAWLSSADLRAWIEWPKYRFQRSVQSFDKVKSKDAN